MSSDYPIIEGVVQDDWGVSFIKKNKKTKNKNKLYIPDKRCPLFVV